MKHHRLTIALCLFALSAFGATDAPKPDAAAAQPAATQAPPAEPAAPAAPEDAVPTPEEAFAFYSEHAPWVMPRLSELRDTDPQRFGVALDRLQRWMILYRRAEKKSPKAAEIMLNLLKLDQDRDRAATAFLTDPTPDTLAALRASFQAIANAESDMDAALIDHGAENLQLIAERLDRYRALRGREIGEIVNAYIAEAAGRERHEVVPSREGPPNIMPGYWMSGGYLNRGEFIPGLGYDLLLDRQYHTERRAPRRIDIEGRTREERTYGPEIFRGVPGLRRVENRRNQIERELNPYR